MGKEEITENCTSPTGGFGRSSTSKKTNKQKKVPQRGLGVAQLEKIRLEEQQKKAVASVLSSSPTTPSNSLPSPTKSSPCVVPPPNNNPAPPVPVIHYQPPPPSSIPFPSLPSLDLSSPFRPSSNADGVRKLNSVSTMSLPNNGFEIAGHGNVVVPNLWNPNCDHNNGADLNKETLDPGFAFRPSLHNLPTFDNSNPIWPLPNFQQRTQQFHHPPPPPRPPPPPSLVNVSSTTSSSSSSSVLNFHTEPPSNQNYYSNYTTPIWSEEERMIGMKRPYPFSQDNNAPSINFKFPTFVSPPMRADETSSCGNRGGTFNLDPGGNTIFREGPTCSTSITESNSKITIKENVSYNGDFLTLAPPTTNRTCQRPKFNFPPGYLAFHKPEVPDFTSFPYQGSSDDTIFQPGPSGSPAQQVFYTFIPPAKPQLVRPAATMNNCNGEVGETVDLNLKL